MKASRFIAFFALCVAFSGTATAEAVYLVQGTDYQNLKDSLSAEGIGASEEFPLINALSVTLDDQQKRLLESKPAITRIIDHVDSLEAPSDDDASASDNCAYLGSIFMRSTPSSLVWPIRRKDHRTSYLLNVELTWPAEYGAGLSVFFDSKPIPHEHAVIQGERAFLTLSNKLALQQDEHLLSLIFDQKAPTQSELTGTLTFSDNCSSPLVKSYAENNDDTHFNRLIGASSLHELGVLGQGVAIAVLDSGLWSHPDLELDTKGNQRILARFDAMAGREPIELFDESGHGTHIASVAVNSGFVSTNGSIHYQGSAPDAYLVPIKAFNTNGQATLIHLLRALQWVADNRERLNIRILNLSFASHPRWPYWLDPINQGIINLWHQGVVSIASVGNSGPDPVTVGAPANIPYIISVGAVTDNWTPDNQSDDFVPLFSSQGPSPLGHVKPDLVAPGGHIEGLTRPSSTLTLEHPDFMKRAERIAMTGTSQAAAIVSGATALLLQLEPQLTPDQVKCRLMSAANPAILPDGKLAYSPLKQGAGLINIERALTLGDNHCDNGQDQLIQEIQGEIFFTGPVELDDDGTPIIPDTLSTLLANDPAIDAPITGVAWGVKAHVERLSPQEINEPSERQKLWLQRYADELRSLDARRKLD